MKKSKLCKGIALLLSIASVISMAGCQKGSNAGKLDDSEPLPVSMLYSDNPSAPFKKDWLVVTEIEKQANVKLDVQVVPMSDIGDKRKIIFNSGELPDLIGFTWSNDVSEYIGAGIILPISKYEDKLPNMMKRIREFDFEEGVNDIRELDGNYYVLPQMKQKATQDLCMFIRQDVFDANNIPIPKTYDELFEACKKLKEIYPDSYPITNYGTQTQFFNAMGPAFGDIYGFGHPYGYDYNKEKDTWEYIPTTSEFKDALAYAMKLNDAKLLDPEVFTQDRNQWVQKLVTGKSFVTYGYFGATTAINDDGKKTAGEGFNLVEIMPLAGPDGQIRVTPASRGKGASVAIAASKAKDPNFDRFMEFVDWLYFSEDGIKLTSLGVEGVTYEEKDGKLTRPDTIRTATNPAGTLSVGKDFGLGDANFRVVVRSDYISVDMDPRQEEYNKALQENGWIPEGSPTLLIKDEDKEECNILVQSLKNHKEQSLFDFMFGQRTMEDWDAYVAEAEQIGSTKLIDLINKNWKENRK